MHILQTPDGRPLDDISVKLYNAVATISRLNFTFVGLLLVGGCEIRSASIIGLAIPFYKAGSIEALLAGGFTLGQPLRKRLSLFYSVALIVPELGVLWLMLEHIQSSIIPPWDSIMIGGACAILMSMLEAARLARYRAPRLSLSRAMRPALRASLPYGLAVVFAGVTTLVFRSGSTDLAVGIGIVAVNIDAHRLLDRVACLRLVDTVPETEIVQKLVEDYPLLGIVRTSAWQTAAATYRRFESLRGRPA